MPDRYYLQLAAAFVRGRLAEHPARQTNERLFLQPLASLSAEDQAALVALGLQEGLRLHKFKRTMDLPRVKKVLGMLKGIQPEHLLDIGTGRGAFLWTLLDTFPVLPVTCVDVLEQRVADILAVQRGGIAHLSAIKGDATMLPFTDRSFAVVTMLEVLEHILDTEKALSEVCRVARDFVIFSVPSKEDNNPEHIHLFDQQALREMLGARGVHRLNVEYVPNHMIVVAKLDER
ncbi:MAG TPA: class I SAM-dependent methyltransferase [Ktedonobacterales bacterium]|jgi:hypothetical protein